MAIYKDGENWRAVYRYTDWTGERKQTQNEVLIINYQFKESWLITALPYRSRWHGAWARLSCPASADASTISPKTR